MNRVRNPLDPWGLMRDWLKVIAILYTWWINLIGRKLFLILLGLSTFVTICLIIWDSV